MSREVPSPMPATLWRADGRRFQTKHAAYYAIARRMVIARYPRWLDNHENDDRTQDELAKVDGIADWRSRRARLLALFYDDHEAHFRTDRWSRVIRRLARFLSFVDARQAELGEQLVITRYVERRNRREGRHAFVGDGHDCGDCGEGSCHYLHDIGAPCAARASS